MVDDHYKIKDIFNIDESLINKIDIYVFKDNYYNVILNIQEMLRYQKRNKGTLIIDDYYMNLYEKGWRQSIANIFEADKYYKQFMDENKIKGEINMKNYYTYYEDKKKKSDIQKLKDKLKRKIEKLTIQLIKYGSMSTTVVVFGGG